MGLIEIKCLKCGKTVEIDRSLIGQRFSCPECKAPFEVKENISSNIYDESHNMNTSQDSSTSIEKSCLDTQQKSFDFYKQHNFSLNLFNHSIKQRVFISICKGFGHLLYLNQKEHLKRMFCHVSYIFAFIAFFFFLLWFLGVHVEYLGGTCTYPICSLFPRINCEKCIYILSEKNIYTYSNFMAMVSGLLYFSLTFGMLWCLSFHDKFSIYGGEYLWLFTLIRLPHLPYTSLYSFIEDSFLLLYDG